jgi:hypothetical protein
MRSLTLLILSLATSQALAAAHPVHETCKIVTGYGTAIGQGATKAEALENARLTCGTKLIDQYFAQRRDIPEEAVADLSTACVNLSCQ